MYQIISSFSSIVRLLWVPNPFEPLPGAIIINLITAPILQYFTYFIVGLFYDAGSEPAVGSILYLVFFIIHVYLLKFIGFLGWTWWTFGIVLGAYLVVLSFVRSKSYDWIV